MESQITQLTQAPGVKVQSTNPWPTREFPGWCFKCKAFIHSPSIHWLPSWALLEMWRRTRDSVHRRKLIGSELGRDWGSILRVDGGGRGGGCAPIGTETSPSAWPPLRYQLTSAEGFCSHSLGTGRGWGSSLTSRASTGSQLQFPAVPGPQQRRHPPPSQGGSWWLKARAE